MIYARYKMYEEEYINAQLEQEFLEFEKEFVEKREIKFIKEDKKVTPKLLERKYNEFRRLRKQVVSA